MRHESFSAMLNGSFNDDDESTDVSSLGFGILFLILAVRATTLNQMYFRVAMQYVNAILDMSNDDMLENSTLGLMGAVPLAKVYYWRGRLYKEMSNGRSALKVKLDPSLFAARLARLHLWQATDIRTYVELHAECVTFLGLAHPQK